MIKNSKKSGFTLVEIVIGAAIIIAVVLAVMNITQKSVNMSRRALQAIQASFLLEEGAEAVRINRDNAWSNISSLNTATTYYPTYSGGTWSLSTTASQIGIFTRTVNIANVNRDNSSADIVTSGGSNDPQTKLITVTVSWVDAGVTVTKTLVFYIADILS